MIALGAPSEMTDEKAEKYRQFYELIPDILPCSKCATNFRRNLEEDPVDTQGLFEWSVRIHNTVNKELGKKPISSRRAKNQLERRNYYIVWIAIVLVLLKIVTLM